MNYITTKDKDLNKKDEEKIIESGIQKVNKKKRDKTNINNYFDQIYVINLQEDYEKLEKTTEILNKFCVKFKVIKGVNVNSSNNDYVNRWLHQSQDNVLLYRKNFNYGLYLKNNPKLKNMINEAQAWNHYVHIGSKKGYIVYDKSKIVNSAQLGCLLAHVKAIDDALENKYEKILILEDDNMYHKNFRNKLINSINNLNQNWDLLYLGAIQKKWINLCNLYRACNTLGAFAYGLNYSLFRVIKKLAMSFTLPYDKCLQQVQNDYKCYVIYPNLVITDIKNSKIHRTRCIQKYAPIFKWNLNNYIK